MTFVNTMSGHYRSAMHDKLWFPEKNNVGSDFIESQHGTHRPRLKVLTPETLASTDALERLLETYNIESSHATGLPIIRWLSANASLPPTICAFLIR